MREVILNIRMSEHWLNDISKKFTTPIRFLKCMPHGDSGGRGLIEIDVKDENLDDIITEIKNHPDVNGVDISTHKNGKAIGSVVTRKCAVCEVLTEFECYMSSAISMGNGQVEWNLIIARKCLLPRYLKRLRALGCKVELKAKKNLSENNLLTRRQEEIVRIAFLKGYFDLPKKITLEKLAKIFGISSSTLNEILQRGERKIVLEHLLGSKEIRKNPSHIRD